MAAHVIGNMSLTQVLAVQAQAQTALKEAMKNERSKRWGQVTVNYTTLLKLLSKKRFPADWTPPPWYNTLMYETHYHLGISLQRLNEHEAALKHYNNAIVAISIPKSGCAFDKCRTNTCLHTPLYAKRALAHIKHAGDVKNALKDAEKAVVLDNKNPNVYCIRAMVHSTMGERKRALHDLKLALTLDSNNVCALVVRGAIDKPRVDELSVTLGGSVPKPNKEHIKACLLKSDAQNFLDVADFNHPRIIDFYDRFLYSLNVPHTVCHYNLVLLPTKYRILLANIQRPSTAKHSLLWADKVQSDDKRGTTKSLKNRDTPNTCHSGNKSHKDGSQNIRAFRAGTASQFTETVSATERRIAYAQAVRRAKSAPPVRPWSSTETTDDSVSIKSGYIPSTFRSRRAMSAVTPRTLPSQLSYTTFNKEKTPTSVSSMRVMEKINVKFAPRMYVKPWSGDRIPPADKEERVSKFINTKPFVGVGPYR